MKTAGSVITATAGLLAILSKSLTASQGNRKIKKALIKNDKGL